MGPPTRRGVRPGLDVRAVGGYAIVPPSLHTETGRRYEWKVSIDDMTEAPAKLVEALGGRSGSGQNRHLPKLPDEAPLTLPESEVGRLRQALDVIPADDYDVWYQTGMALENTRAGAQAFWLWVEWSRKSSKFVSPEDCWRHWCSFGRREVEITVASIYGRAKAVREEMAKANAIPGTADADDAFVPPPAASDPATGNDVPSSSAAGVEIVPTPDGVAAERPMPPAPVPQPGPIARCWEKLPPEFLSEEPPSQDWFLEFPDGRGYIPWHRVGLLAAAGGVGKSFLLILLAVAACSRRKWLDTFHVSGCVPPVVVMLCGEEDRTELHRRIHRAAELLGLDDAERAAVVRGMVIVPLAGELAPLLKVEGETVAPHPNLAELEQLIRKHCEDLSVPDGRPEVGVGLVIIDPLARFGGAAVEGRNDHATALVQILERLLRLPGGPTVILACHSSKAARGNGKADVRGVTGLHDAVRFVWELVAEDNHTVRLRLAKSNLGPPAADLVLRRREGGMLTPETDAERENREGQRNALPTEGRRREEKKAQKDQEAAEVFEALVKRAVEAVTQHPGESKSSTAQWIGGNDAAARRALMTAVERGLLFEKRTIRGHFYYPASANHVGPAPAPIPPVPPLGSAEPEPALGGLAPVAPESIGAAEPVNSINNLRSLPETIAAMRKQVARLVLDHPHMLHNSLVGLLAGSNRRDKTLAEQAIADELRAGSIRLHPPTSKRKDERSYVPAEPIVDDGSDGSSTADRGPSAVDSAGLTKAKTPASPADGSSAQEPLQ